MFPQCRIFGKDLTAQIVFVHVQCFPIWQGRDLLVTLGKDETGAARLKLWNVGEPGRGPALLRTIDCFAGKHAGAVITQLAVHDSQPQLVYALGLATGYDSSTMRLPSMLA